MASEAVAVESSRRYEFVGRDYSETTGFREGADGNREVRKSALSG